MARLSKEQIKDAVLSQLEESEGYDTDELAALRKDALDYYYNRKEAAPSMAGRSSLQSSDVADMVEHVVTQIMPAFEGELIAEFPAESEEDIEQARLESMAVSHVVMDVNNGDVEFEEAIRDALLMRNGITKVYLDEKINTGVETYINLTMLEYGDLRRNSTDDLSQVDNGIKVEELSEEDGFYSARVTTKTTKRKVCVNAIDPANFSWEQDYDSIYLDDCRFVAERSLPTRSDLLEMGYKKSIVKGLNAGGNDSQIDNNARNQEGSTPRVWKGATPADDIIECHECYIRLDADGDGVAELLKVVIANKTILEVDDAPYIPYAAGTPFLQPHRFNGLGLFDKLRNIQDQKTHGIRQWADNLNNNNNSRIGAVEGMVNLDDIVNSRPGGVIRMTGPNAIVPIVAPDIGQSCLSFLDYGDKIRSERGGASIDLGTAEMQVAGNTAHGVERQTASKEQMSAKMTKTIANTLIRTVFELTHRALRLYVNEDITFAQGEQFQTTNPAQWQERSRVKVKGGISVADRAKKVNALEQTIARQDALKQQGYYVSEDDIHNAHTDWLRAQGVNATERYWTDPQSEEAAQAKQQMAQQAQQQQEYQQELLNLQKEVEGRKADNEDAKVMEDARQHNDEIQFKYWEAGQKQETEEAKAATTVAMGIINGGRNEQESNGGSAAAGE